MRFIFAVLLAACSKPAGPAPEAMASSSPLAASSSSSSPPDGQTLVPSSSALPSAASPEASVEVDSGLECGVDLPAPIARIELVPSPVVARAILPSLDVARMTAAVIRLKDPFSADGLGRTVVQDCRGGSASAIWATRTPEEPTPAPGSVKVLRRKTLPDGHQAVWLATTRDAPAACVSREGYGFLAIVGLVGQRVVTLGVRPWSPSCIGKPELRAEKLGDETVFVEPAGFDTGCGNHSWESVWTLRDGDLHVAGHYPMRAGAGGDCGPPGYDSVSDEATVRYSGSKILLSGTTGTSKCTDADGGSICSKQSITWSESYGLRDGGIVQEPVPVGAPKRFFFPGEVPATPPPDPQAECAAGDLGACYRAGLVFAEDGWRQDAGRASRLFGRACDGGLAGGCFELGKLYSAGQGVKKSDARASQLWDRACTAGSLLACGSLGSAYDHGDGVTASPPRALELYTRACDGGELTGCLNLGVKYDRGDGVGKDSARAARLYDRACTGGQAVACFFLGLDYENGEGVTKDLRRSVALFEKGCEADARSCVALGVLYELGTVVQKDDARAFSLYETGCSSGVSSGCIDLAEAYADGRGAPKDEARAVALFKQGCTLEPASCFGLGLMYESGRGAPADRGRAIDLFRKGCASGDDWFCKRLDHLDASR